jgi:hypothetical protein
MLQYFNSFENYNIVKAEVGEDALRASGGLACPKLTYNLRITIDHGSLARHYALQPTGLEAELSKEEATLARSKLCHILSIIPGGLMFYQDQPHPLEFDLDRFQIEALEKIRDGGDLRLSINFRLYLNKLRLLNPDSLQKPMDERIYGIIAPHCLCLQTELLISRDRWTQQVLPQLGYGQVHIVEMPAMPLDSVKTLKHAFDALRQAESHHRNGLYDDAVGKCRVALDPFFETIEVPDKQGKTKKAPVLKTSWETKLGKATYDWLNASLGAIKDPANKPHHSPNNHFDQFESQMIIALTTNLVAYAARHHGS